MRRWTFDDLSFDAPAEWTNASLVTLIGRGQHLNPTLVVTREQAPSLTLKEHAEAMLPALEQQLVNYRLQSLEEKAVAGQPGCRLIHHFDSPEGIRARQEQSFFVADHHLVVIACTAAEAEWAAFASFFQQAIQSFQVCPSQAKSST